MRDLFNRPVLTPDSTAEDRVSVLRTLAGELQAAESAGHRWLGRRLTAWLHAGGRLEQVLGVAPPRGSRRTAQALVQRDQQDAALMRLSVAAGSDAAALRILAGADCPPACREALADAQAQLCPTSRAAFTRARSRSAARQWR